MPKETIQDSSESETEFQEIRYYKLIFFFSKLSKIFRHTKYEDVKDLIQTSKELLRKSRESLESSRSERGWTESDKTIENNEKNPLLNVVPTDKEECQGMI